MKVGVSQVTVAILVHASSSPAADSAGRKGRDGTVDASRESVVLDLLGLHMQLARGQHVEEQPGQTLKESCTKDFTDTLDQQVHPSSLILLSK